MVFATLIYSVEIIQNEKTDRLPHVSNKAMSERSLSLAWLTDPKRQFEVMEGRGVLASNTHLWKRGG